MPALRVALFVGDVLTKRDVRRLQRLAPSVTAVNMYGTTETQRAVSFLKVTEDNLDRFKEILPSGVGMRDVQLLVLRDDFTSAGIGELAELYVRSPHMSAGYLGLPDKTAEKFLVNPVTQEPGDRLYRTGDLGRYQADGSVECVGRADDQVKIRGFRIELGEIDTYLSQHPDVRENKTLVVRDAFEEKQIVAYFVHVKADEYSIESIRAHLHTKLAAYAVPSLFVPLHKMPLTPNGKIDKKKLPAPDAAAAMLNSTAAAAQEKSLTDLQQRVMDAWTSVLGRPVGLEDNFFQVGGHSILATQLTFALRQALRQELPLDMLYKYPTVLALSAAVGAAQADATVDLAAVGGKATTEVVDPRLEVTLDVDIDGRGRVYDAAKDPAHVFLTGATGFLGAFLAAEILNRHKKAIVTCLVRGADADAAKDRVVTNMRRHAVWSDAFEPRLKAVCGDLGKPKLGLSESEFAEIAEKTDVIFHNGAMVHWVYP
eukprot:UC1_evm1s1834